MAVFTRRAVSAEIRIWVDRPLRMYDAVVTETPARRATSVRVAFFALICGHSPYQSQASLGVVTRSCLTRPYLDQIGC